MNEPRKIVVDPAPSGRGGANPVEITLSLMVEHDLQRVLRLEQTCFSNPWPEAGFRSALRNPFVTCLVARAGSEMAGYIIFGWNRDEMLIANLAVDPALRRRGIARRLLDSALQVAAEVGAAGAVLDVRESNVGAISLYERSGFSIVGRRSNYYSDPVEDSLIMRRSLESRCLAG